MEVLRLVQLCPTPPPWCQLQDRPLPFPPKFLLQFSHLQTQRAAGPWPNTAPGWALHCQLWFWRSLYWLCCPCSPRRGSYPSQQGSWGKARLQGSSQGPWRAGQRGRPEAGAIAALGISPVPHPVAISRTELPTQAPGLERREIWCDTNDSTVDTEVWGEKPFKHLEGDAPPQLTSSTWMSGPKHPLRHTAEHLCRTHFLLTYGSSCQTVGSSRQLSVEQASVAFCHLQWMILFSGCFSTSMFVPRRFVFYLQLKNGRIWVHLPFSHHCTI